MIRSILLFFVGVCVTLQVYSQAPEAFQFQAVVKNVNNTIVANKSVNVSFKIHQEIPAGSVVFSETHQANTNAAGIVNLKIGKGTALEGTLGEINWADGPYFIETGISYDGTNISLGTQQLVSVPFAKYAKSAENGQLKSPNGKVWSISVNDEGVISTQELTK